MDLQIGALDVLGWTTLRRDELSLLVRGDGATADRVAAALDERRGDDVVDIVLDVLTADGFRATPDFALATPDGRVVVRGVGEVRQTAEGGDPVDPVVATPRMPWLDEDVAEGVSTVTLAVVGAPEATQAPQSHEGDLVDEAAEQTPSEDEPATPQSEEPQPAAPAARSGGWVLPSVFAAAAAPGGSQPPAPSGAGAEPPAPAEGGRPALSVVPDADDAAPGEPAPEQPIEAQPAVTPIPDAPAGEPVSAGPQGPGGPQGEGEDEDLPSFDFLFGNTSHHRSSLIAEAEQQEAAGIDSGPVAAAGGFQAPEDAANATLAPPAEDEPEAAGPAQQAPDHAMPGAPAPAGPAGAADAAPAEGAGPQDVPATGPGAPPAFDPPPATEAAPSAPPPPPQDGLISSVPWSSAPSAPAASAGPAAPPVPSVPGPAQPPPPPAAPDAPHGEQYAPPGSQDVPLAVPGAPGPPFADHQQPVVPLEAMPPQPHGKHDVPPPPQAPFGIGLPGALPTYGTPTESGPRPLEPASEHDPHGDAESTGPMVLAVRCPDGHASAPHAVRCRVCGADLPSQQPEPTPRPSLGVLRLSTGDVVTLDRGVLVGRAPKSAPELPASQAPHLVRVPSPDNEISRNHVEVILDGWHVLVRDLGSTNGTTITLPGDHPVRLRPGDQQSIEPGTTITLADQVTAVFEVTG